MKKFVCSAILLTCFLFTSCQMFTQSWSHILTAADVTYLPSDGYYLVVYNDSRIGDGWTDVYFVANDGNWFRPVPVWDSANGVWHHSIHYYDGALFYTSLINQVGYEIIVFAD